jgi:hypothetical protein
VGDSCWLCVFLECSRVSDPVFWSFGAHGMRLCCFPQPSLSPVLLRALWRLLWGLVEFFLVSISGLYSRLDSATGPRSLEVLASVSLFNPLGAVLCCVCGVGCCGMAAESVRLAEKIQELVGSGSGCGCCVSVCAGARKFRFQQSIINRCSTFGTLFTVLPVHG